MHPVYIEHVSVDSAAGKVANCNYDPASRCLLYEFEIYDPVVADKIRDGLIQHVSVGADYDALDVVVAKIPHGLSKPELSLVAVPGIPERTSKSNNYPQYSTLSAVRIDYAVKKPLAISLLHDQWCRLAYNLPIGASKEVAIGGRSGYQFEVFFDEIWVIAK